MNFTKEMLSKLFWPKDLRVLVRNYKAQGVLNGRACKNINKRIKKYFWQALVVTAICMISVKVAFPEYFIHISALLIALFFF